ncbi:MAG: PKD domain-containing protein [Bacteroidota bacterium]|nr:PKD domain-containing protein [Bacteroidota bacterium]
MKRLTFIIYLLLLATNSFAQGHFIVAFTGNGQDHMNLNVVTATIGGVALKAGDEIAAFDGTICCGKYTLSQPIVITNPATFAIIAASRKDDGLSNGYTVGHAITYKFWDASWNNGIGRELSGISTEYFDNTGAAIAAQTYTINGTAIVKLTVAAPVNQTPVANAGPDQTVNEGGNVTLDGSVSSDADGNPLTYSWTAPAGITLSSATVAKPTFTAPQVTQDTQYTFSLVVNDGTVNSQTDQVIVTVKQVNKTPTANAGSDQSVNEGAIVTLDGTASNDPDSDPLSYLWTPPTGITLSSMTSSQPTFTTPEVNADTQYTFSLVINDGIVNSTADQVVITVKHVNKAPVANAGPDQSVNENVLYTLDGSASTDPEGDPLTYKWTAPAGITLSSLSAAKPTFTAPAVTVNTNYVFTLVVNDGKVDSPADQVIITVKRGNQTPTANAGPDQSVNEGVIVTLDGTASNDPDSDPLTYLWTPPIGITLSSASASKPTFTAPEVNADTQYTFSLVVNDGTVNSTADLIVISVKNIDSAPYVKDPIKDVSVDKKSPNLVIDLRTVFADNDPLDVLSYIVSSNSNSNVVTTTITGFDLTLIFSTENTGSAEIEVSASSNGKSAKSKFQVEVKIPTGIDPLLMNQNVKIYPNPTSGIVNVVFEQIPQNGTYLTVRSIIGMTVLQKLVQNKEESIDLSGNTPGVYLIQTNQNSSKVRKVILK